MFTDTHCHLYKEYYENLEEILNHAYENKVNRFIVAGCDDASNKEVFNLLTKENKKLRKENALMKNELNELSKYKAEYEDLIVHVKEQKERYMKLNKQLENLILDCESNLKKL